MKSLHQNLVYAIVALFVLSVSCNGLGGPDLDKGCKKFPEQKEGTGEIIPNATIVYATLLNSKNDTKEGQIITSDSLNVSNLAVSFDNGETYIPIDFSKYTVIGKYAESYGGCKVIYERDVTKDVKAQKYVYTIKVIECASHCMVGNSSKDWVLIPKIEDGYTVEFVVEHVQWNNGRG